MEKTMEDIQDELQQLWKRKRYQHTLGVRYTAQSLAMCYGEDIASAGYAGLLHDCAKYLSGIQMRSLCEEKGISCSETERENPSLLHAKLGAYLAKEQYGVEEESILSAIRWHTTGKPGMSALEKIVFIADYIEPGRKPLPHMEQVRRVAFQDLDEAMYEILYHTIDYLRDSGAGEENFDHYTLDAYDFYRDVRERRRGRTG